MSSYNRETKHPQTDEWELASWYDDLLGPHHYGVLFPSDYRDAMLDRVEGSEEWGERARRIAFDPDLVALETREGRHGTAENFEVNNPEVENILKDIGHSMKDAMPEGMGFAFLMFDYGPDGSMFYISSAKREDMIASMKEFIEKNERELP